MNEKEAIHELTEKEQIVYEMIQDLAELSRGIEMLRISHSERAARPQYRETHIPQVYITYGPFGGIKVSGIIKVIKHLASRF